MVRYVCTNFIHVYASIFIFMDIQILEQGPPYPDNFRIRVSAGVRCSACHLFYLSFDFKFDD
jgi:hypothetical protein